MTGPLLEVSDVAKDYRALRPLRIARLAVAAGELIAIVGLDQAAAEVFVNLVTGATLPDRGEVKLFGRPAASIDDSADWLRLVDRFGIVTERAVLLEALSVTQNLAMAFTLEIEPPPEDVRGRAQALAREVELPDSAWEQPVADLNRADRMRVRLARALALDPAIVLLEHATATLPRADILPFARHLRHVADRRGAALIAATADEEFAGAVADRILRLDPATGRLAERRRGRLMRYFF